MKLQSRKEEKSGEPIWLILQSDDFGFCHASNLAHFKAFKEGILTTAELQVPPPWFNEAAEWCRMHPEFDVGIHLTLTCEWRSYRWKPVLPYDQVPSLVNGDGYFYPTNERFLAADPKVKEAEKELRAQIQHALDRGVKPSHLSTHMYAAISTPDLREMVNKISEEYGIPAIHNLLEDWKVQRCPIRNLDDVPMEKWEDAFCEMLKNLKPGIYHNLFHIAIDTPEFRALAYADPSFNNLPGSWTFIPRPKLYEIYTSPRIKKLIRELGIELINYRKLILQKTQK